MLFGAKSPLQLCAAVLPLTAAMVSLRMPAAESPRNLEKNASLADPTDAELREFLRPVPPLEPADALKKIEAIPGFHLELVAAEPQVFSPIAGAFDEDGNLYVCEMRDYPYKPGPGGQPIGSVRLLRDTDGDGRFDQATVFADKLLWAAGVVPWKGGVFVASTPDIWYLKDTDGDGVADLKRRVFTGFGVGGEQYMVNNLQLGRDHKIYGVTASNGGSVRILEPLDEWVRAGRMAGPEVEVSVARSDFRFDPATGVFEKISGTAQFGNTFDDWGRRFTCGESRPALHIVLPLEYLARNPHLPVPTAIANIAPGPVPIFRISGIERWRQIRSSRRILTGTKRPTQPGASHHVVDGGAGVTIYRGGAYPMEFHGQIFTPDAQNNLIHRRAVAPKGATFTTRRVDERTEFVRSSDQWFRPVNLANAPDGTLYAFDMAREIIESVHVPLDVLKHIDLTSGRNRGRILRIAPNGFKSPPPPRLSRATTAELVAALESPHGWWRDTASRLIHERQDRHAVAALKKLATDSRSPQARLHAVWALQGLDALDDRILLAALADAAPGVRENAVRMAEKRFAANPSLLESVLARAEDGDARVRFQVTLTLGESNDPRAFAALAKLAHRSDSDEWTRTAVLSSMTDDAARMFALSIAGREFPDSEAGAEFLESLALIVGNRNQSGEVAAVMAALSEKSLATTRELGVKVLLGLGTGLKRSGGRLDADVKGELPAVLSGALTLARQLTMGADGTADDRAQAVQLLSCFTLPRVNDAFAALLKPSQPRSLQQAAVGALAEYAEPAVAELLLAGWSTYLPAVRMNVIQALLSRDVFALAFLRAIEAGRATAAQLDPTRREMLLEHQNAEVRALATRVLGRATSSRQAVVDQFQASLQLTGVAASGAAVFERTCAACHQVNGKGHAIGPDLAGNASLDASALLVNILDPNRYLQPAYVLYVAEDRRGRSYSGMIEAETASSITLKRADAATDTLLRSDIAKLTSLGVSLMPEGLEGAISQQEMADLLAFLRAAATKPAGLTPEAIRVRDFGSRAGAIEPRANSGQK